MSGHFLISLHYVKMFVRNSKPLKENKIYPSSVKLQVPDGKKGIFFCFFPWPISCHTEKLQKKTFFFKKELEISGMMAILQRTIYEGLPHGVTVAQLVLVQLVWVRIPMG